MTRQIIPEGSDRRFYVHTRAVDCLRSVIARQPSLMASARIVPGSRARRLNRMRRRGRRVGLRPDNEQELGAEITAKLRALRANGPVSADAGQGRVVDVLQPYIDDLTRRKERGARRAAADIAIAVLSGLYGCREDTEEDMLLVRMGLPGVAGDLAWCTRR